MTLYVLAIIGALGCADSLIINPTRFWANWLVWSLMLVSAGLGSLFLVAIEHLTGERWSIPCAARLSAWLRSLFPAPGLAGRAHGHPRALPWAQPGWPENPLQIGKTAWLNIPFFTAAPSHARPCGSSP